MNRIFLYRKVHILHFFTDAEAGLNVSGPSEAQRGDALPLLLQLHLAPLPRLLEALVPGQPRRARRGGGRRGARLAPGRRGPSLKGSIGEGPNRSNFSDQSSVRILGILGSFLKILPKKNDKILLKY